MKLQYCKNVALAVHLQVQLTYWVRYKAQIVQRPYNEKCKVKLNLVCTATLWQAWLVMVSCFTCNGIIFGIINTFGILFVKLRADLEAEGLKDAALKCCKLT